MSARRRWFLPHVPDVIGLLGAQMADTLAGMDAFVAWAGGDAAAAATVRDAEHRADRSRRALLGELRSAFTLPLDAEDLYSLSERLDDIINAAKNLVQEAEVMALAPGAAEAAMAPLVAAGVRHLDTAFRALGSDPDAAAAAADAAIAESRDLERAYRKAMSTLLEETELKVVMGRRELYRRMARLGDAVAQVAERVWYAVVKET